MADTGSVKESSISVAVRVRPLTPDEKVHLQEEEEEEQQYNATAADNSYEANNSSSSGIANKENLFLRKQRIRPLPKPHAIRKILDVVDDRMLVFDPKPAVEDEFEAGESHGHAYGIGRRRSVSGRGLGNHNSRHKEHKFIFDKLFDETSTQNDIYENTTKPSIEAVLDGYNSTVFAYGATGCGKTYTISGTRDNPGIIFLAVQELFSKIEDQTEKEIEVQVSYLEIYNETIRDLLNIETSPRKLTLLENENKEIIVSNLTKVDASNVEEVMDVIVRGNFNRAVSATEANLTSSRSHAVIQVYITQTPHVTDIYEKSTKSVLSIIDLAGCERASATKNKGARLHEGANINKSLLALGNCINALCDLKRSKHIPYRDSKLTRLLKFSLGGNCKTVMIVCVSPSSRHYDETLNALKFANRAKEIKTKVVRNRTTVMKHVGSYMKIIADQKRKIYELETLMDSTVKREILKYAEQRSNVKTQMGIMIDRLWNNVSKCEQLKSNKIYIVARRKMLLIYTKQLIDFCGSLEKFDIENKTVVLRQSLGKIVSDIKSQIALMEEEYNQRTELDIVLLDTSDSFLGKLRELESWCDEDEVSYAKEVEYLKTDIEKQIFYESSVLFDSWLSETSGVSSLDSIPSILAQFLCMIENIANNIQNVEDARMQCYQLSDSLIQNCMQQLGPEIDTYPPDTTHSNNRKRKNSGNNGIAKTDESGELSFIRQGNRINSINNKLMRINLNSVKDDSKNANIDSLSEVESSLILENDNKPSRISSRVRSSSHSLLLQSESTPQKTGIVDDLSGYISPGVIRKIENNTDDSQQKTTTIDIQSTIPEWDESNSSVIIRKGFDIDEENINPENKDNMLIPHMLGSPFRFMTGISKEATSPSPSHVRKHRNHSGKLTTKKLVASPRITSPHRLVGLDSSSSNMFQFKIRESMGNIKHGEDAGNPNYDRDNDIGMDVEVVKN
ncbi:hypothetical protein PICMEDRAFT_14762 [Pichia membranifaciens NRRL Y-2026]|uniref:Kinesin motor domain-containing protein n=1 Tax=Pichia membranifaciens NRRL Y-2026 TaxID=763406 RepID=A0A1E3NT91_9ASCO|nr:hypothetical protein PICMEDRAFT_14762 [Pichia membranifaciens NRRL Y-2026]ODQ49292.1 hypothetical protein PICMEDRAFT_14762 [Pichia membranifaciens NRRL Y-2026]